MDTFGNSGVLQFGPILIRLGETLIASNITEKVDIQIHQEE